MELYSVTFKKIAFMILLASVGMGNRLLATYLRYDNNTTEQKQKFALITILYNESKINRCAEYIACLERNLQHPLIGEIHVLYDKSKDDHNNFLLSYLKTRPVTIHYICDRPTYAECFAYVNDHLPKRKVILANADIYFNETLNALKNYDLTGKFLALTRYDLQEDGRSSTLKIEVCDLSQDVWIFATPIRKFRNTNIKLGVMGCDSTIAYYADQAGMDVLNPCKTIQCIHLHRSAIRNYDQTDLPYAHIPYLPVPWVTLS